MAGLIGWPLGILLVPQLLLAAFLGGIRHLLFGGAPWSAQALENIAFTSGMVFAVTVAVAAFVVFGPDGNLLDAYRDERRALAAKREAAMRALDEQIGIPRVPEARHAR